MDSLPVAVVIVSYNGQHWIRECLRSVTECLGIGEIVVVDNASSDQTCDIVRSTFPGVTLIEMSQNTGFGYANNVGISRALQTEVQGVLLLNQDARIASDAVQTLTRVANRNPQFGILSPMQLNYDGTLFHRGFLKYLAMSCNAYLTAAALSTVEEVYVFPNAPAAIWYLPLTTLVQIGGFDPLFFVYCEDSDYVNRTLKSGMKVGLVPAAVAFHDDTPGIPTPRKLMMLFESQQKIFLKECDSLPVGFLKTAKRCGLRSISQLLHLDLRGAFQTCNVLRRLMFNASTLRKSRTRNTAIEQFRFLNRIPQNDN